MSYAVHSAAIEDMVQEAWVITLRDLLPHYRAKRGSVFGFVRVSLRWKLIDLLERQSVARTVSLTHPEAVAITDAADDELPPVSDSEIGAAYEVLSSASKEERFIFNMRQKGRPHAEIASKLGISERATRIRFHRLCERIRAVAERQPS